MLMSSLSILLIIWLDLCISQLAPTSYKTNPREWGFHCPNDCMKRGICVKGDMCKCQNNWHGPDCSIAVCPYDYSYNTKPIDFNIAHSKTECSSQGICDITTGKCKCFSGFEGTACQRQSCLDSSGLVCGGHGTCMTIDDIYKYYTVKDSSSPSTYSSWDADHTTACVCDEGYTGPACQVKMCPKGDDPLTPKTGYKVITITTTASGGTLDGYFLLRFNQYSVRIPAKASEWTEAGCVESFQSLPVIGKVTCTKSVDNAYGGATYTVTIKSYPLFPKDNNIFPLDGTVNTGILGCDASMVSGSSPRCIITDSTPANTLLPEYVMCSNRGNCDIVSGNCDCSSPLFYGPNCGAYRIVDISTKVPNPVDILGIDITHNAYTHTILGAYGMIGGNYPRNNGPGILPWIFNTTTLRVLDYSDNAAFEKEKFHIDAEGNIKSVGGWKMGSGASGITVRANGLVTRSGLTVTGILTINTRADSTDIFPARFLESTESVDITGGLKVTSSQDTAISNGLKIFNGGLKIGQGGITTGSIWDVAYVNDNGIKVNAGGGTITAGGLYVTNGVTVSAGGISGFIRSTVKLSGTGLTVTDGMRLQGTQYRNQGKNTPVLGYNATLIFNGNLGTTIRSGGLTLKKGLSVATGGLQVTKGGLTIEKDGIKVTTQGLTISNGGLNVYGGLTLTSSNLLVVTGGVTFGGHYDLNQVLSVTGGVTVFSDGLYIISKGMTAFSSGVYITTKGLTIANEGAYITAEGLTINSGGLLVTGGMTLNNNVGLQVTHGVTIMDEGLAISGGMTVVSQGQRLDGTYQSNQVNGGISIVNGLKVTGGITTYDEGLYVTTKGLTVNNEGMFVSSKGLTVKSSGLNVILGGLTTSDKLIVGDIAPSVLPNKIKAGLTLTGGLTLSATHIMITAEGLTIPSQGLAVIDGGFVNKDSGLKVTGGLTVSNIGLTSSGAVNVKNNGLAVTLKGLTVSNLGLTISDNVYLGDGCSSTNAAGFKIMARGLKVTADSSTNQLNGALLVTVITIRDSGLKVTGGVTIKNLGIYIIKKGLTIDTAGLKVDVGGLTVQNGEVSISGGLTKINNSPALRVTRGFTLSDTGLVVTTKGLTVAADGLVVAAKGFTIESVGLKIPDGGLTVKNLGLTIIDGGSVGLQIKNSDLLTESITIQAGGLKVLGNVVDDGFLIKGGVDASQGISIKDSGLIITQDGLTVSNVGLVITTKGLTVKKEGLVITGGLTVAAGSLQVSGGLTIKDLGLVYSKTDGGTISVETLSVTGGATTFSGGMSIRHKSGKSNVNDIGLKVLAGGLKVYGIVTGFCDNCHGYNTAGTITNPWSNNVLMPGTLNGTALPSLSDKSTKTNFASIDNSIGIVRKLRGFSYNWIDDPPDGFEFDKKKHIGLMAQDVQDVLPDLVVSRNNTYLEVNYMEIIPLLVDAVGKLNTRIENNNCTSEYSTKLIDEIYSLRNEIISLEQVYDALRKEVDKSM